MYLRRFEVTNYMIHRNTVVDLSPLTIFVGPNNAGKSAFFDALLNFSMVSRGKLSTAFGLGPYSFDLRRSQGLFGDARISFRAIFADSFEAADSLTYSISYGLPNGKFIIYDEEMIDPNGNKFFDRRATEKYPMGETLRFLSADRSILSAIRQAQFADCYEEPHPLVTSVAKDIGRLHKYRLDPANLGRPGRLPDASIDVPRNQDKPRLSYRGEDLASVLFYLTETQSSEIAKIKQDCCFLIDGFTDFEFNTLESDRIGFSLQFNDARGVVPAPNLSDGTLVTIGLIALFATQDARSVTCIEEPEAGLTPRVIRGAYEHLFNTPNSSARSQVLISSHSPHLLTAAYNGQGASVFHMQPEDGITVIKSFDQLMNSHGTQLAKDKQGRRTVLNPGLADQVMDGPLSHHASA